MKKNTQDLIKQNHILKVDTKRDEKMKKLFVIHFILQKCKR